MAPTLQVVIDGIGSIRTTHAPTTDPALAGLHSRKLVNNKWLYTEKKHNTVYTQLHLTGKKKSCIQTAIVLAHRLRSCLCTDCDHACVQTAIVLPFCICVYLECNGNVLSKNNVRLIQLDKINTYATTLIRIPKKEFNKTMRL